MKILETLRARVRERRGTAEENLIAAANRAAAGESVDPMMVDRSLVDCGKDVDYFEQLVDLARRRMSWRLALDKKNAADARIVKATTTAERERAEFDAQWTAWQTRSAELDAEIRSATAIVDAAATARENLVRPENIPGQLGERLAEAIAERNAATDRVSQITRDLKDTRQTEKDQREWCEHKKSLNQSTAGGDADDHDRRAKRAARRAAELLEELKTAQAVEANAASIVRNLEASALKT